jgi:hypothetical protein
MWIPDAAYPGLSGQRYRRIAQIVSLSANNCMQRAMPRRVLHTEGIGYR